MKKIILIASLFILSGSIAFAQFTGTNPASLNGSAFMTGDMTIGPSGLGPVIGGNPIVMTPTRKLNIYKDVPGGIFYPFGTPLATYTTGLKIVHRLGSYLSSPAQHYNWEVAADNKRMYFHFANTNKTIMIANADGQVGIGQINPNATLHVKNFNGIKLDAHLEGFTLLDGDQASLLLGRETGAPYGEWGIEYNEHAKGLNFWKPSGSNGFGNYFMFITDGGKVSIGLDPTQTGTYDGDYKLYVGTGILTEKLKVSLRSSTEWSDYIFSADYELMPLSEVEKYINTNSHLPGVPSAEEVVESGIDVAKMDATLLGKIEELTLYIIDMEKKLNALKTQVELAKN
ncbi:MAG: hypothetical protein JKX68_11755 [Flavobacteriales bacterium]|nr:hypothetical protein [Flavobacteriales bacterium]